jgi:hypothetical protein
LSIGLEVVEAITSRQGEEIFISYNWIV